ncbi:MAG: major capsid protein [Proteobacteria bacterium]|nr:major capsid protein [Pseudomonadota bacterium]
MAVTQIADVVVPTEFTAFLVENVATKAALVQSGLMARNAAIDAQLKAGADSFSVPFWRDLSDDAADLANDNPASIATPRKLGSGKQLIRKAFLHAGWSAMNLASELSGSNALTRIQERVDAYWTRELQRRLIASLNGILADNAANDGGDMIIDISGAAGTAANFSAGAVIDAAATLGDSLRDLTTIGLHSSVYKAALKSDLIQTVPASQGGFIQTFRGLAILIDDELPLAAGVYTSVLFGAGAFGFGVSQPRVSAGTEIESVPGAGNGGGQQILHSRVNLAVHPAGFQWREASVAGESPSVAELAMAANWDRVAGSRKHVQISALKHKLP